MIYSNKLIAINWRLLYMKFYFHITNFSSDRWNTKKLQGRRLEQYSLEFYIIYFSVWRRLRNFGKGVSL